MKSENLGQTPIKEFCLVGFHGENGTAIASTKLGTLSIKLGNHPTWVLDSQVALYVALKDVLLPN